jgi:E3 ubiquitin-protein ligase UBR7
MNNNTNQENNDIFTPNEILNQLNTEWKVYSKLEQKKELKECTYSKGYHSQELFACMTCYKDKQVNSCICLGCAFECHTDHDLVHLYFKRNLKCDCGNSKFSKI